MSATVSVVLPYYNRADSLREAALSVLGQTHRDLVLLMVDDGSTDGSRDVAASLDDERVRHIDLPRNVGVCAARNAGLASATTDLVAFMDSDDVWLPHKLERQVATLRARQSAGEELGVLGCGWHFHGHGASRTFAPGPFTRRDLLRPVSGTGTPMLLVDRSVAAPAARFDASFPALVERDFILSCLSNGALLGVLPEVLVTVNRGRDDHVANPQASPRAWELYITKYAADLAEDPELDSWYHFRAGREYLVARRPRGAARHVSPALRRHGGRRAVHLLLGSVAGVKGLAVAQKTVPL